MLGIKRHNTDRDKLVRLYERYKDMLFRFARTYFQNQSDAEDAVQETFARIAKHLNKIDEKDEKRTRSFLFIICRNISLNMLKKQKKLVPDDGLYDKIDTEMEPEKDSLSIVINRESARELIDAIKTLKEPYQDVVFLRFYHDFTYDEIAKLLQIEPATARKRIERARVQLAKVVGKESDRK